MEIANQEIYVEITLKPQAKSVITETPQVAQQDVSMMQVSIVLEVMAIHLYVQADVETTSRHQTKSATTETPQDASTAKFLLAMNVLED